MKLNLIRGREAAICAAIGVVGALVFLFAFPRGSISTLMHEVLGLPGPGAGIALVLGPFLVLMALISRLLSRRVGGALIAALTFGAAYALVTRLLEIPTNPKGAFGSPVFIAAVALFGIVVEAVMVLGKALPNVWRCMLCGALANAGLLGFYWAVIFPHTAGRVSWKALPVLLGLCLACGLVSGYIAWAVGKRLSSAFALNEEK
ncbi:MAG: hypothetical protein ABIG44_19495 [Planctomycetota bacterium]